MWLCLSALEGSEEAQSHPAALRRCVSVAAATSSSSALTDLGFQGDKQNLAESTVVHPSIDDLRKQVTF